MANIFNAISKPLPPISSLPKPSTNRSVFDTISQSIGSVIKKSKIAEVPGKTLHGLGIIGDTIDYAFGTPGKAAAIALGKPEAVPYGFSKQVEAATQGLTGSKTAGTIAGFAAGLAEPIPGAGEIKGLLGAEDVLKLLAEANTTAKVTKVLATHATGLDEAAVKTLAPKIAKSTDQAAIRDIIDSHVKTTPAPISSTAENGVKPPEPPSSSKIISEAQNAFPEDKAAVMAALRSAKRVRPSIEAAYSAERTRRLGAAKAAAQGLRGQAAFEAEKSKLGGALIENPPTIEPVRPKLAPATVDNLIEQIRSSPLLEGYEKIHGVQAFNDMLDGKIPTPGDMQILEDALGSDFIKTLTKAATSAFGKFVGTVEDIGNIPRSVLSTGDFSALGRQGAPLLSAYPRIAPAAIKQAARGSVSQKVFEEWLDRLYLSPEYRVMKKSGLFIADPRKIAGGELNNREEAFMSNIIENIDKLPGIKDVPFLKGIGQIVSAIPKASSRNYSGLLNYLRASVFTYEMKNLQTAGKSNPANLKKLANWVNMASGRGNLGRFARLNKDFNALFFSPSFAASRVQMLLSPATYATAPQPIRRAALTTAAVFAAEVLSIAGIAKMAGLDVNTDDPTNPDYLRVKHGNSRYDFSSGTQPWIRFVAQELMHKTTNSSTGKVTDLLSGKFGSPNLLTNAGKFTRSKLSPIPGAIVDLLLGTDLNGDKVTIPSEVKKNIIPLFAQDIADGFADGGYITAALNGLASEAGIGVQTYNNTKTTTPATSAVTGGKKSLPSINSLPTLKNLPTSTQTKKKSLPSINALPAIK